jgi:hypothetical protein
MKKILSASFLVSSWVLFLFLSYHPLFSTPQQSEQTMQGLKQRVALLGQLNFKTDIPVTYLDKNRLRKYIGFRVDNEYPTELAEKEGMFIDLMGFSDKPVDVKKLCKKILASNAGAHYNEKTKELLALKEYQTIDMMNSMLIVHELRHAVLDAHFDLATLLGKYSAYDDRGLALIAAIEGDASLTALLFNGFNPQVMASTFNSEPLMSLSPLGNTTQLSKITDIVKHRFTMPVIDGLRFVTAVFAKKKWKGINTILASPPDSSEQILHPEKYIKREKPLPVTVQYHPEGYDLYHSGVIGEYYLNVLLMAKPANKYLDFANGWGGDTFNIYRKPSSYFLVWKSAWDEEKFCSAFYFIFKQFIEKTFLVNFKEGNIKGSSFIAGQSGDNYYFLRKARNEMIYVRTNDRSQMNKFIYGGNYD